MGLTNRCTRTLCVALRDMADRIVFMFHGLGGDRNTMLPIGEYCARQVGKTRFLPIEGPVNLGDRNSPCLGWFDPPRDKDRALDGPHPPQLNGIKDSLAMVHATIDKLVDQGMDPLTIHLLGHSQGGAIAIAAGLTYPRKLGSVCTIAGYLAFTRDMEAVPTGTNYFLHHSEHDDNVGFRWADYARSFVERTGNRCTVLPWDIRDNPHSIHDQQLDAICTAIADVGRVN